MIIICDLNQSKFIPMDWKRPKARNLNHKTILWLLFKVDFFILYQNFYCFFKDNIFYFSERLNIIFLQFVLFFIWPSLSNTWYQHPQTPKVWTHLSILGGKKTFRLEESIKFITTVWSLNLLYNVFIKMQEKGSQIFEDARQYLLSYFVNYFHTGYKYIKIK